MRYILVFNEELTIQETSDVYELAEKCFEGYVHEYNLSFINNNLVLLYNKEASSELKINDTASVLLGRPVRDTAFILKLNGTVDYKDMFLLERYLFENKGKYKRTKYKT